MAKSEAEIANALMNGLYSFVCKSMGDSDGDPSNDPFVAWCLPGIPFEPEDFRFAQYMLNGQGANDDERVRDAVLQLTQAAGFSRFVDFVPSVDGIVGGNMSGGVLRPGSATLSEVYKRILEASQAAEIPQPEGIDERIKQLSDQATPMKAAYDAARDAYDAANAALISANLAASFSAADALKFQATGGALRSKVIQARQAWEVTGFKTKYEGLLAEIASMRSKRSPAIWRSEAISQYEIVPQGQNAVFGEARVTMPYPGSFATNANGWSTFTMDIGHIDELNKSKSQKWQAGGGFGWSSWRIGGSGQGSTAETIAIKNTSDFSLKLSIAQIPLIRTWFDPWFLKSDFWRMNPASVEGNDGKVASDGGSPPSGLLVAYPVSAIFVRDVQITMAELRDESSELTKTLKAEGRGGWGLGALNVRGSYERNSQEKRHQADPIDGGFSIPGLQLVGFQCETMGKSPNPKEGLTWVGGA
jgi:hypothetical protein